jgi:sugar phosphate permease
MKRYLIGATVAADAIFTLSLDADTWQKVIVFVAIAAAIILAVVAVVERIAINEEREHAADLADWIHDHHEPTSFHPFEGDEKRRS